jgi:hypothetical protein
MWVGGTPCWGGVLRTAAEGQSRRCLDVQRVLDLSACLRAAPLQCRLACPVPSPRLAPPFSSPPRCLQAPAFFTGSEVRMRDPDQPNMQFAVAFKGASWTDPDSVPLMVMQASAGGSGHLLVCCLICLEQ